MIWNALLAGIPGLVEAVLKGVKAKTDANRDISLASIGSEKEQSIAALQAAVDANKLKAAAQPQFTLLIYLIALPPAAQAAGVYLDSLPWFIPWLYEHKVGAWGVPTPPPPYDGYQRDILLSFFIVAPVAQGIRALGSIASAAVSRR